MLTRASDESIVAVAVGSEKSSVGVAVGVLVAFIGVGVCLPVDVTVGDAVESLVGGAVWINVGVLVAGSPVQAMAHWVAASNNRQPSAVKWCLLP